MEKKLFKKNEKFCKYHSLIYFEQANSYCEKYLKMDEKEEAKLGEDLLNSLKKEKSTCLSYIKDISTGAIVLINESFNGGFLISDDIVSRGTGLTKDLRNLSIGGLKNDLERCKIVLSNYEKVLSSIQTENTISKKEAICIANIIKLHSILGELGQKCNILLPLARRVELIVDHENIDKNEIWYKEFVELNEKLKKKQKPEDDYRTILAQMKQKHGQIFDKLDDIFNTKGKNEFIKYILKNHPYPNYENDKKNGRNFDKYTIELIQFLHEKYQPETPEEKNEKTLLDYCINHEISKKLSNLLTKL